MSKPAARTSTALTVAGLTVLGGAVAYALYFDYKRRNDAAFRKQLRKDKKKASKAAAESTPAAPSGAERAALLRTELAKIRKEDLPASTQAKEKYFMEQAGLGEQLCTQGPAFAVPAALAFFRALRVYPSPVELLMLYQSTVPPEIFAIIMELTNLDLQDRVEGYYNFFPPKSMNVSVQGRGEGQKKILVAEKDFNEGDVIYTEEPVITALDPDLLTAGVYCSHCLKLLHSASAVKPEDERLPSAYCSYDCEAEAKIQYQTLLFTLNQILPSEMQEGVGTTSDQTREAAEDAFVEYLKAVKRNTSVLVAKYVARQVTAETAKMMPQTGTVNPVTLPKLVDDDAPEYALSDHLERLRFVERSPPNGEKERQLLCRILGAVLPGLEQSLNDERHVMLYSKIMYNAYGICYSGGRDDRPTFHERPEDQERTRTPHGTSRQIGSGLYAVSAYISHSCDPNARPAFKSGNATLHLVATRPIKKGDELTVSYVDVSQHDGETPADARRRRRHELARGWRFKCECTRCVAEEAGEGDAAQAQADEAALGITKDESQVEDVVTRVEGGAAGAPGTQTGADVE